MKLGELWTMAGGSGYASKPRPVVIVQDDAFTARDSVTVCLITTDPSDLLVFRVPVEPTTENGLRAVSRLMVDKDNCLVPHGDQPAKRLNPAQEKTLERLMAPGR